MKTAFLNYCERAIEYFQPEYAAIGIEVNSFYHPSRRKRWPEFVSLHHYVYGELKKKYPSLPLFATLDLHAMMASDNPDREGMLAGYKEIMDANDILAISFYPFFRGVSKRVDSSLAWLTETFDPYNKPYAVGETGESAENVVIKLKDGKHEYKGRPEAQEAYFEKLLALAQARRFKFVIAWFYRDPIAVERYHWEPWQHCGFLDENGATASGLRRLAQVFPNAAARAIGDSIDGTRETVGTPQVVIAGVGSSSATVPLGTRVAVSPQLLKLEE